jgi:hypothetical protein
MKLFHFEIYILFKSLSKYVISDPNMHVFLYLSFNGGNSDKFILIDATRFHSLEN